MMMCLHMSRIVLRGVVPDRAKGLWWCERPVYDGQRVMMS